MDKTISIGNRRGTPQIFELVTWACEVKRRIPKQK